MNHLANLDMSNYWNGDGGKNWIRFEDRMDNSLLAFGRKAVVAANILPGERVLDIGCGCGDTAYEIARKVGPSGKVLGIDISELVLAQARRRLSSTVSNNISFECMDAQTGEFASSGFDVAFSRFGVMFFDDPVMAFKNIRKALSPGGRFVFICWQSRDLNQWVSLPLQVVANHLSIEPPSGPEEPGPFSFGNEIRVSHILKEAGFVDVSINSFLAPFKVGADIDEAVTFLTSIGPASAELAMPDVNESTRMVIADQLRETLRHHQTSQGVELGAATWVATAINPQSSME